MLKGLIPRLGADGQPSITGRTYKYELVNKENGKIIETLLAKKKDDVVIELKKCPKIQEKLIDILKNGLEDEVIYESNDSDADLSDEDFERQMEEDIKKIQSRTEDDNEAEETSWGDL